MSLVAVVAVAIWIMLPAYVPNNIAVLAGGGRPIDGGRMLGDRRLLGDGKTWRGTAVGIGVGIVVALALNAIGTPAGEMIDVSLPTFPVGAIVGLPAGAMLGDILASFLKRRTGRERGAAFPLVDQLDFVVVSLAVTAILTWEWVVATITLPILVTIFVITPVLHLATNAVAYGLGLKNEPW